MWVPNLLELARRADVDQRTLVRFFSDQPVRPRVRARIERELTAMRRRSRKETPPRAA